MSGRTAKRLRRLALQGIPRDARRPGDLRRLKRGWRALAGAERADLGHDYNAARRLMELAPATHHTTRVDRARRKRGGAGMLLRGRPRVGGPAKHPGKAWLRARRERLAAERGR